MKYMPLGRSGLLVLELCLGAMVFGEEGFRGTDQMTTTRTALSNITVRAIQTLKDNDLNDKTYLS